MSVDLNGLKTELKSIFDTANTTTASRDLSSGLATRVQRVLKVNPARIPIQASFYPCVTTFIEGKQIELKTISKDQTSGRRVGTVAVKVVGVVWNSTVTNKAEDAADDDCESLMENVEEILRANPTLNSLTTWSFPTEVTYHTVRVDEQAHLRAGILNLEANIWY